MRFIEVRYNRLYEDERINRAIVSAPVIKTAVVGGKRHKLLYWRDVHIKADGKAYSPDGKPLNEFNLNFEAYGATE